MSGIGVTVLDDADASAPLRAAAGGNRSRRSGARRRARPRDGRRAALAERRRLQQRAADGTDARRDSREQLAASSHAAERAALAETTADAVARASSARWRHAARRVRAARRARGHGGRARNVPGSGPCAAVIDPRQPGRAAPSARHDEPRPGLLPRVLDTPRANRHRVADASRDSPSDRHRALAARLRRPPSCVAGAVEHRAATRPRCGADRMPRPARSTEHPDCSGSEPAIAVEARKAMAEEGTDGR